jgi:hypothetical protein
VSGIYTNQLIPAIVTLNFGKVASEDLPYATLEIPVPKDQKAIAERLKIISEIGLPVTLKWAYEEMGIPEPQEGDTLLGEAPPQIDLPMEMPMDPLAPEDAPEDLIALDLLPTPEMAQAAQAALEARRIAPIGQRGMTAAGLQRARDIAAGVELTQAARNKMKSFFATAESGEVGSKQWQTYQGWGGDAGKEWSNK